MDKIQSLTGMLDLYDDGDMTNTASKLFAVERIIKDIFIIMSGGVEGPLPGRGVPRTGVFNMSFCFIPLYIV